MELRYLEPENLKVWFPTEAVRPACEIENELCTPQAQFRWCFPLTNRTGYLSICDGAGKEVGILRTLDGLDAASRAIVERELETVYFTPQISKIRALKQEASMWKWDVDTQRGPISFYLRGVRDSVHEVAPGRWQVYSVDGQRYEIRNFDELDAKTQHLFESLF